MLNSGDPVDIRVSAFSACRLKAGARGAGGKTTDRKSDGSNTIQYVKIYSYFHRSPHIE